VGPPPSVAIRRLGVLLAFCCQPPIYASQQPLSMIVNAGARRSIHRSMCKVNSANFAYAAFSEVELPLYGVLRRSSDGLLGRTLTTIASKLSL
jgi:hypothetical protein